MSKYFYNNQLPLWSFQFQSSSRVEFLTRKDIETRLIIKALKDQDFKNELLSNSKPVIEKYCGIELPAALSVKVVEETDSLVYLVLPHNPYLGKPGMEPKDLLDVDLEDVAKWVLEDRKSLLFQDIESNVKLLTKAWNDDSFKKLLIKDPVLIIEHELGEEVKRGITIEVMEETDSKIFIVVPASLNTVLEEKSVNPDLINLPIVIGSHANTQYLRGVCSESDTHSFFGLECVNTTRITEECLGRPLTVTPGYWSCPIETQAPREGCFSPTPLPQ